MKLHAAYLSLVLFLASSLSSQGAVIAIAQFIFDDFGTPYSEPTEGEASIQPGVMEVTSQNPHQVVVDDLISGDTTGARRTTTLDINPAQQLGDLTLFTASASGSLPPRLSLNADFLTAGRVITEYDFTPTGQSVDASVDTTHVIIDLVSTDRRASDFVISFTDALGTTVVRDAEADLGADLTVAGAKLFPFSEFGNLDFSQLTAMKLTWTAGTAYDGEIALIATGVPLDQVPEPSTSVLLLLASTSLLRRRR